MKNLKDYIKESILGDWEDIDVEKDIKSEIEQFLEDNYRGRFSIALVGGKYIVNSKTNVGLKNTNITSLTNGMFEFGKVKDFNCSDCNSLTSLKGAPKVVGGDFYCMDCNSLKSLEGAPKEVSGDFSCKWCNSLKTLKGAPEKVGEDFYCYNCNSLTSLEGAPEEVGGDFYCYNCKSLTSLKGAPKEVDGCFSCSYCKGRFTEKDVTDVCNVKGHIII